MLRQEFGGWLTRGDGLQRFAKMFLFSFVLIVGMHSAERVVTHFWRVDYLHEPITSFQFWLDCFWFALLFGGVFTIWPPGKRTRS